jgi:hypothetical protein
MSISMWIVVLTASWLFGAVAVGLLLGRMIRIRDRQTPDGPRPSLRELLVSQAGHGARAAHGAGGQRRVPN